MTDYMFRWLRTKVRLIRESISDIDASSLEHEEEVFKEICRISDRIYTDLEFIHKGVPLGKIARNSGIGRRVKYNDDWGIDIQHPIRQALQIQSSDKSEPEKARLGVIYLWIFNLIKTYKKKFSPKSSKRELQSDNPSITSRRAKYEDINKIGGYLFVASFPNYLNSQVSVMHELVRRGYPVTLLVPSEARKWEKLVRVPDKVQIIFFEEYLIPEVIDVARKKQDDFIKRYLSRRDQIAKEFVIKGVDIWPKIGDRFESYLEASLQTHLQYVEIALRILNKLRPDYLVVSRVNRPLENSFVYSAKALKIRSALLPHSFFPNTVQKYHSVGNFDVDLFFLWGLDMLSQYELNEYLNNDVSLFVTGNPEWDKVVQKVRANALSRGELKRKISLEIGADEDAIWVTFTTGRGCLSVFKYLQEALRSMDPRIVMIVKIHPAQSRSVYLDALDSQMAERLFFVDKSTDVDLHELLRASDVVTTYTSTTGLEACLVGTPLITAAMAKRDCGKVSKRVTTVADRGLPKVNSVAEFREVLENLLQDIGYREQLLFRQNEVLGSLIANFNSGAAVASIVDIFESISTFSVDEHPLSLRLGEVLNSN